MIHELDHTCWLVYVRIHDPRTFLLFLFCPTGANINVMMTLVRGQVSMIELVTCHAGRADCLPMDGIVIGTVILRLTHGQAGTERRAE